MQVEMSKIEQMMARNATESFYQVLWKLEKLGCETYSKVRIYDDFDTMKRLFDFDARTPKYFIGGI